MYICIYIYILNSSFEMSFDMNFDAFDSLCA